MNLDEENYATWFNSDKTLTISNNDEDRYAEYEDGSLNYDSWYYEPLVPNQILYLTVGEYTYVSEDEMYVYDEELGYEVDNTDGHGKPGYNKALFDQAAYDADNGGGIMPWRVSPLSKEAFPRSVAVLERLLPHLYAAHACSRALRGERYGGSLGPQADGWSDHPHAG